MPITPYPWENKPSLLTPATAELLRAREVAVTAYAETYVATQLVGVNSRIDALEASAAADVPTVRNVAGAPYGASVGVGVSAVAAIQAAIDDASELAVANDAQCTVTGPPGVYHLPAQ